MVLDLLQQLICICQTIYHSCPDLPSIIVICQCLNTFVAPDTAFFNSFHIYSAVSLLQSAKYRLCNTACNTKDNTASGTDAKWYIRSLDLHPVKYNTGLADHPYHFRCSQHIIHILLAICKGLRPQDFLLLCRTRHNGNGYDLLSFVLLRILIIFTDHSSKHLLWRAAGRKIWHKFRIFCLTIFHPCRTAGCKQWHFLTGSKPFNKLLGLFHNCQIRTVRSIINLIKAQSVKHTYQLTHYIFALCIAKMISNGHTYRRSDLCDHLCIFVSQCFPYFIYIGTDTDRTCRTDNTALSTANTVCFCDLFIKSRHYLGLCSAVCKINGIDILHIVAHSYAVTTKDTFIRISDNGM